MYTLDGSEQAGYDLFRARPAAIPATSTQREHADAGTGSGSNPLYYDGHRPSAAADVTHLFTCFGYANSAALNPQDAIYYQTTPDPFGLRPIPTASASEIWDSAVPQKRAAPNPKTRLEHNSRRLPTAMQC